MAAASPGQWTSSDFNGVNAPTALDGISVSINGKPAYVWYLSQAQLNVQAPEDAATGNVAITVTNCKATSLPFNVHAPGARPRTPCAAELQRRRHAIHGGDLRLGRRVCLKYQHRGGIRRTTAGPQNQAI